MVNNMHSSLMRWEQFLHRVVEGILEGSNTRKQLRQEFIASSWPKILQLRVPQRGLLEGSNLDDERTEYSNVFFSERKRDRLFFWMYEIPPNFLSPVVPVVLSPEKWPLLMISMSCLVSCCSFLTVFKRRPPSLVKFFFASHPSFLHALGPPTSFSLSDFIFLTQSIFPHLA